MTAPFSFFTPRPAPGPYRQAPALLPDLSTSAPRPSDIERALVSGQLDPEARAQMAAQVQAENAQTAHNAPRSLLGGALQNITIPLSLLSIPTSPLGARSVLSVREATNKAVGADPNAPGADLMELLGGFTPVGPELLATRGAAGAATAVPNRAGLLAKALGLPDPLAAARPDVGPLKGMLERIAAPEVLPEAMNAVQRELSDAKGYATRVLSDPEASPELVQTAMARLEDAHLQHELAGGGFTYDPRTRQLVPKEGFAVANPPGARSVDRPAGAAGAIREAMQRNAELLRQPDMMLGGWTDQKVGRDMIEVSQVRPDLEEAMALARQRGEKAVWDLARGVEIPVEYTKAAPNSAVQTVVSDYLRARPELAGARLPDVPRVDEARASQMAGVYARLKSDPTNPEVQRAYRALVDETKAQYQALQDAGYRFEFVDEDPYKSSAEMTRDLRENRRLRVFKSKEGDHPLLSPEENTIFRAVHDAIGHGAGGSQFGPHGEELAYRKHAAMFSPLARRAMATETRGQNSWVNFGPHRALPPAQRPFAEQKAALWPEEFLGDYGGMPTETPADPTSWVDRLGQMLYDPGRVGMGLGGAGRRRAPMKLNSTRTLPLSDLLTSSRSMREAQADIAAGRGSRTKGPVRVWRTEDGRLLVTDGQHRLAEAAARGDRTISVKLTGEGYSDYWATPRKGEEWTPPAVAEPKTDRPFRAAGVVAVNKKGERRIFEGAIHPQAAYKATRAGFRVDPDAEALGHNGFVLQDGTYVSRADAPKHLKKGEVPKAERLTMGEEPADPLSDFQLDSIPSGGAQTALKLGDNLFDISPEALREVPTFGTHAPMAQPPGPSTEKTATNVANLRRRGQSPAYRRAAEAGLGLGGLEWYNTQQLFDRFTGELGPEQGERAFRRFMDMIAATSPGSNVSTNIKLGSNFFSMAEQGQITPEILRGGRLELAPGYKHRFQSSLNAKAARILEEGGLNPVADPKTARFGAALSGNYANVPVDLHISRGLGLTNTAGKPLEVPESWQYGAVEDLLRQEAERVGVTPAQYQAAAWLGMGDKTGVASGSRSSFLAILEERLGRTAKRRGTTKEKALRALIRGEAPLE